MEKPWQSEGKWLLLSRARARLRARISAAALSGGDGVQGQHPDVMTPIL